MVTRPASDRRPRTHATFAGKALVCLYPALAAFAATYRVVLIESDPVGTAIAVIGWILLFRGLRTGVRVLPDSMVVRGLWMTRTIPIEQVRSVFVTNEVTPMAIGGGFWSHDYGLALTRSKGRRVGCPSIYGRMAPQVARALQLEITHRRKAARAA